MHSEDAADNFWAGKNMKVRFKKNSFGKSYHSFHENCNLTCVLVLLVCSYQFLLHGFGSFSRSQEDLNLWGEKN